MFCHGELVRLKPAPKYLTRFYLMVSLGGAAGLRAGRASSRRSCCRRDFELAGGLVVAALLLLWQVRREHLVFGVLAVAALVMTIGCARMGRSTSSTIARSSRRAISTACCACSYSAQRRLDYRRSLIHGTIVHGTQYLAPDLRAQPTTYYTQTSGIGRLLEVLHPSLTPLKVGVIGLGTGTLATLRREGRCLPLLRHQSRRDPHRRARLHVPAGQRRDDRDRARRRAAVARARAERRISTFSRSTRSRATRSRCTSSRREALAIYRRHMKPGGVIAFHVTNRFLNLVPVVEGAGARARPARDPDRRRRRDAPASSSDWVLLSDRRRVARQARADRSRDARSRCARTGGCGPTTSTTSCRC